MVSNDDSGPTHNPAVTKSGIENLITLWKLNLKDNNVGCSLALYVCFVSYLVGWKYFVQNLLGHKDQGLVLEYFIYHRFHFSPPA